MSEEHTNPGDVLNEAIKIVDTAIYQETPLRLRDPRYKSRDGYPDYMTILESQMVAPIHEERMTLRRGLIALKNQLNKDVYND